MANKKKNDNETNQESKRKFNDDYYKEMEKMIKHEQYYCGGVLRTKLFANKYNNHQK